MDIGKVTGLEQILANLKMRNEQIAAGISRGVKLAGLALQRESQTLVPVDFGVLKASAFTRAEGSGYSTKVTVGYTAAYAIYVHENVEMKLKGLPRQKPHKGFYWDPQGKGQSKFLEEPARRLAPQLRQIILDSAKIR